MRKKPRPQDFTLTVNATDQAVPRAHAWIQQAADQIGLDETMVFALQLCLEEAVSNIARHSESGPALPVNLRLHAAPGRLTLRVEDAGRPFDPTQAIVPPEPQTLEEAEIGGLGIHLIRRFSTGQVYERVDGVNRLALYFDA
jgi:serine/threonine-protein kinase RsbW